MARHRRFGRRAHLGSAGLVGLVTLTVTAATGLAVRSPDGPTGTAGTLSALNAASTTERPNFVLILADDLDQMTSPYWDAMPHTAALIRDSGLT